MSDPTPKETLLGKLALLAHQGKQPPLGEKPSPEELAMLYDDQLDFNRKQEVMSHLNADPILFKQWMDLVDVMGESETAQQRATTTQPKSVGLLSWMFGWKGFVSGMATAGFAALIILQLPLDKGLTPSIEQPTQVASQDSKDNTASKVFISPDKRAIAAGIDNALAAQEGIRLLEKLDISMAVNQQGSALEPPLYQQYYQLGELVIEWEQHCYQGIHPSQEFLKQANTTIEQLSANSFIPLHETIIGLTQTPTLERACKLLQQFLLSEFE